MALDKSKLENTLKELQSSKPPSTSIAAQKWAEAISDHAKSANAADTSPSFTVDLRTLFEADMTSQIFLQKLGVNLQSYWQPVTWSSSAFTGITALALGSSLDALLSPLIADNLAGKEPNPMAKLADIIHTWTLTIQVSLTNNQSGVTSLFPVT